MSTAMLPATMTAAEFIHDFGDSTGVELVNGQLVRNTMPGTRHGNIEWNAATLIGLFAKEHSLGQISTGETFVRTRRDPDGYRGADVAFISYQHTPRETPLPDGPLETPPELVVEVRSPTDRMKAVREKTEEYLAAGVKVVIVIDPETESVGVFRDNELPFRFHNGDLVTVPDVLPGFATPVKSFFE